MKKLRVGIIGVGKISGIYLQNLTGIFSDSVTVVAIADLINDRAEVTAAQYPDMKALNVEELINCSEIDLILNLTIPKSHFDVCLRAVESGKHVYVEKPLCITREEAKMLLSVASKKGVRVGGAPDTFLGAGIQTCRKLIDDGWIGTPVAATAFMMNHGHEHWHPAPEFYYKLGGGPLFDMGPYYLTALVNLLGPITRVCGSAKRSFPERKILSDPLKGSKIEVEIPTHIAGVLDFADGVVGTIIMSFDVWSHTLPFIEIYGSEGTLRCPDPNTFGGPVYIKRGNAENWYEVPLLFSYSENSRGLGIAEMAHAIDEGCPHRASGELASHVLEIMHGFYDASASGMYYQVTSTCARPEAMRQGS